MCVCKCTLVQTKCRKSEGHFVIYDQILDQNIDSNNDYSGNYIKEEEKEAIKMVNNDYWLYIYLSRSFPFFFARCHNHLQTFDIYKIYIDSSLRNIPSSMCLYVIEIKCKFITHHDILWSPPIFFWTLKNMMIIIKSLQIFYISFFLFVTYNLRMILTLLIFFALFAACCIFLETEFMF